MRVGPTNIEKEEDHSLWAVSLSVQNMSYYTRWYPSNRNTPAEAIEKFMKSVTAENQNLNLSGLNRLRLPELFGQVSVALLFLEVEELE